MLGVMRAIAFTDSILHKIKLSQKFIGNGTTEYGLATPNKVHATIHHCNGNPFARHTLFPVLFGVMNQICSNINYNRALNFPYKWITRGRYIWIFCNVHFYSGRFHGMIHHNRF